jgi:GNAT superfamily N-acetyltransferase
MPDVPEQVVRHFTFYDPRKRLVVAATAPIDHAEELVGLADVATVRTGLAELALVVDDHRQGQGVGTLLSEAVAALARRNGATHLKADLLTENAAMLRLMERLGPTLRTHEGGTAVVYTRLT